MLSAKGDQKTSPDVVGGMLKVFSIDVYAMLHPGSTLPFFAPVVAKEIEFFFIYLE